MSIRHSVVLFALSACTGPGDEDPATLEVAPTAARSALDGTPEGVGLLAFLNDASTTQPVLDLDVPLDARAATNLVAHRDGVDRLYGTRDDDRFDGVDEVDAISYVGPSALDALFAYVETAGWVPGGDDLLGTYDGVSFTVVEAEATVALANTASHTFLDVDLGLDRRAADSIVAARPIPSALALSELYYVGTNALQALKDAAEIEVPEPLVSCFVDADGDTWGADPIEVPGSCDGYATRGGDCDDARAATHPGPWYDLCDGGIDDDCNPETVDLGASLNGVPYLLMPDAIAAAVDGDTILACDGGYGDPFVVDKDLTIRSINGSGTNFLDVTAMGASAVSVIDATLVLEGWTVTWGEGTTGADGKRRGGGLYVTGAGAVTVRDCLFQENYAHDGAAIWHGGTGLLTLEDTVVSYNWSQREGGGLWTSGPVRMVGGAIEGNDARDGGGGIRVVDGGSVELDGVLVSDNTPTDILAAGPVTVGGEATFTCAYSMCTP